MPNFMEALYLADERDENIFGASYCGPDKFKHGEWVTVARYESEPESDGKVAEIDENRMPARFFRLRQVGQPAYLSTGSGDEMGVLMVQVGKAIARGMVGFHVEEEKP